MSTKQDAEIQQLRRVLEAQTDCLLGARSFVVDAMVELAKTNQQEKFNTTSDLLAELESFLYVKSTDMLVYLH